MIIPFHLFYCKLIHIFYILFIVLFIIFIQFLKCYSLFQAYIEEKNIKYDQISNSIRKKSSVSTNFQIINHVRSVLRRRPTSITKCQSVSTFSSENLSVSDGEEGHTTDHSHSGTPDVVSTNTDDRLDDRSDDLLSQGSEIPADNTDPAQTSDGGLGQSKAQLDAAQNPNEVTQLLRGLSADTTFDS